MLIDGGPNILPEHAAAASWSPAVACSWQCSCAKLSLCCRVLAYFVLLLFLVVLQARWGTVAHLTFLVFCLLTNIIVTSMLILGGAAVVNGLTGGFDTSTCNTRCILLLLADSQAASLPSS
jgi:hypothetical protein